MNLVSILLCLSSAVVEIRARSLNAIEYHRPDACGYAEVPDGVETVMQRLGQ